MTSPQDKPIVRIAFNNSVFDLPLIVGIEQGLFDQAGLDVQFSASYADRENDGVGRWSLAAPGRREKDLRQRWQKAPTEAARRDHASRVRKGRIGLCT